MSGSHPSETRPARMDRLARLPIFYALGGKRAVVAGGGPAAAWKAELLSAAGAHVDVFAREAAEEMAAAAAEAPDGPIRLHARTWTDADLDGAAIAIGDFDVDADAERFVAAARARGVPVNVVDKPAYCDFAFGSIVNRSPLVVGISTDGGAPVFAQAIRTRLETLIPNGFAQWAEAARRWRGTVQTSGLGFSDRRRFWQQFAALALAEPDRLPDDAELSALLAQVGSERGAADIGSIVIAGAGPGNAELLTLRAARALRCADVVLFDDHVPAEILDFARREARKLRVGEAASGLDRGTDGVTASMISMAGEGKRVVRLVSGDPATQGDAQRAAAACERAGIPVEVVPGIAAQQIPRPAN